MRTAKSCGPVVKRNLRIISRASFCANPPGLIRLPFNGVQAKSGRGCEDPSSYCRPTGDTTILLGPKPELEVPELAIGPLMRERAVGCLIAGTPEKRTGGPSFTGGAS